jgi:NTE family protein
MTRGSGRGLVIGCGGTLGFAWTAAVLDSLAGRARWDPRTAEVLVGTSAGAEAVAMLGAGIRAEAILGALTGERDAGTPGRFPPWPAPRLPALGLTRQALRGNVDRLAGLAGLLPRGRGDATWLHALGNSLAGEHGWVPHPATWIMATDTNGRRVAFGSPSAPTARLGAAIAASWAIPGWFPPVTVAGVPYLDGGTVSPTSADLVAGLGLDEVVVVAPMTSARRPPARGLARCERLLRTAMTRRLDHEVRTLGAAGVRVVRIEPSERDLAAMGANLMDHRRRERVLETALTTAPALVERAFEPRHRSRLVRDSEESRS